MASSLHVAQRWHQPKDGSNEDSDANTAAAISAIVALRLQILSYRRQAEMKTNIHAAHQRLDRMTRVRRVTESYRTFHAQPRYVSHARARSALVPSSECAKRDLRLENRDWELEASAPEAVSNAPIFSQFFSAFGDLVAGFPVSSLESPVRQLHTRSFTVSYK